MKKEINEIIKKNLPQQVGELLQSELAELETLRKEKEQRKIAIRRLEEIKEDLQARINTLEAYKNRHTNTLSLIKEHNEKVEKLESTILKIQLEAKTESLNKSHEFLATLVKNSKAFETFSQSRSEYIPGHNDVNGNWIHDRTNTLIIDTTIEKTETK